MPDAKLTLNDWITSSGKYPERASSPELTQAVKDAALLLINKINVLMAELGVTTQLKVSSGFRPSSVNSKIPNAAKRSSHMTGLAIDLVDSDGKLKELVSSKPALLRTHNLFMEDASSTPGWCHLDYATRADRPSRIFKP